MSAEGEVEKNVHYIDVYLGNVTGLRPVFSSSDVILKVEFLSECLLETEKLHLDEIIEINTNVSLCVDFDDRSSFDRYITNPLVLTVTEIESQVSATEDIPPSGKAYWMSEESVLDLQEALEGLKQTASKKAISKTTPTSSSSKKSRDKMSREKTSSKGSRSSKTRKSKEKSEVKVKLEMPKNDKPKGPQVAGIGIIDLLPLFLGEELIEESVLLKGDKKLMLDDRLRSVMNLPKIEVEITIDAPIPCGEICSLTIESLYNLPSVMAQEMKYQLCVELPASSKQLINFTRFKYMQEARKPIQNKLWFDSEVETNYCLNLSMDKVKNSLDRPIEEAVATDFPRLEYNQMKRTFATQDDLDAFKRRISKYHCIGIEIYMQKPGAQPGVSVASVKSKKSAKEKGSSKGKSSKMGSAAEAAPQKSEDYLHLMAYVDLCRLLYPGEKSVRIACPVRTYQGDEIEKKTGLNDSYFRPKPPPPPPVVPKADKKGKKGKESKKGSKKGSKSSKGKDKSSKSSKGSKKGKKGKDNTGDLKVKLVQPSPPPEPSQLVFSDEGNPTFLIVELSFNKALIPPKELEDLTDQLHDIIESASPKLTLTKDIRSPKVTDELFRNTLKECAKDLKIQFQNYRTESILGDNEKAFINYLQRKGAYQTYLASMIRAATCYVGASYEYDPNCSTTNEFHTFISNVYVDLVEKINKVVTELYRVGVGVDDKIPSRSEDLLMYAHEAMDLNAVGLANRYLLERICKEENNPDFWFDYGVYHMHIGEVEKATECALEALRINIAHGNGLILYALLLTRKNKNPEAETCLLNMTLNFPTWVEGWGALYCVYYKRNNVEGMEVAFEMASRALEREELEPTKDYAWTNRHVPNTVAYRTCCYFISMRLFDEAEIMLCLEIAKTYSHINEYLLAVISYYKEDYDHAITHIDNAVATGGCDYITCTFRGHVNVAMGKMDCALEEYNKIFDFFSQPDENFLYFVHIKSGLCYSALCDEQKAHNNILQACKINGSAYAWLCVGVLFYSQHDFSRAEESLGQANALDNRMPETWAYLTLTNVKMGKQHDANMCYHQVIMNNLQNEELLGMIKEALDELNVKCEEQ